MTRREMREHCFKMLFGVDFYPAEETAKQVEQYFGSPDEDDTTADGTLEIVHQVEMADKDREFLIARVEEIAPMIPQLDEEIAKKFGGNDSPAFINGVLARLVKEQAN